MLKNGEQKMDVCVCVRTRIADALRGQRGITFSRLCEVDEEHGGPRVLFAFLLSFLLLSGCLWRWGHTSAGTSEAKSDQNVIKSVT